MSTHDTPRHIYISEQTKNNFLAFQQCKDHNNHLKWTKQKWHDSCFCFLSEPATALAVCLEKNTIERSIISCTPCAERLKPQMK